MVVRIVGDNSSLDKSIDESKSKMVSFGEGASKIGKSLSLFVSLPLIGIGAAALKSSAGMESLETSFTTMLGSASKAAGLMGELKSLAASTPFEAEGLAKTTSTLLQFGVAQQDVIPILKTLGDVAGGSQEKLDSMGLAFGQIQSTGRLMGQDLNQLINAGFNPLKEISRTTGSDMTELRQAMENGAISAQMVTAAFKSATTGTGAFTDGMANASKTLEGLTSTLGDDVAAMGRSFVDALLPAVKETIKGMSKLAQDISGLNNESKGFILTTGLILVALGPILATVGFLATALSALSLGFAGTSVATNASSIAIGLNNIAMVASSIATGVATVAVRLFNAALLASPFGLVLGGIIAITTAVVAYNVVNDTSAEGVKANTKAHNDATIAILKGAGATRDYSDIAKESAQAITDVSEAKKRSIENDKAKAKALIASTAEYRAGMMEEVKLASLGDSLKDRLAKNEIERQAAVAKAKKAGVNGGVELNALNQMYANKATEITKEHSKRELEITKELNANLKALGKKFDEEEAADDLRNKKAKEDELKSQFDMTKQFLTDMTGLFSALSNSQIETINQTKDAALAANDAEMQSALTAAGVQDKTVLESAKLELAEAIAKGTKLEILDAEKAVKKAQIQEEFAKKEAAINKKGAMDAYEIQRAQFDVNKALSVVTIAINTASAIMSNLALGPAGIPLAIAAGVTGAIQAGIALAQIAPAPPSFAEGGIVMPTPGGTLAQVAEAGQPEIIFPLDKLERFLGGGQGGGQGGGGAPMHIVVNLDSKPLLEKIFNATKNRTVLISAGAVV